MKFRLTVIATALSVLAIGPAFAGGAGGCDYGSSYKYTSAEPQEPSEASKKLASLSLPATEQETASQTGTSVAEQDAASTSQTAETTAQ